MDMHMVNANVNVVPFWRSQCSLFRLYILWDWELGCGLVSSIPTFFILFYVAQNPNDFGQASWEY